MTGIPFHSPFRVDREEFLREHHPTLQEAMVRKVIDAVNQGKVVALKIDAKVVAVVGPREVVGCHPQAVSLPFRRDEF